MKKKKKYLPLYEKWMKTGYVENLSSYVEPSGFCSTKIRNEELLDLLIPKSSAWIEYNLMSRWASGFTSQEWAKSRNKKYIEGGMTPLRQNILLLMACLAGEL